MSSGGLRSCADRSGAETDQDTLALIKYIADEGENRPGDGWSDPTEAKRRKLEKILDNPQVIKTPVVRNGKQSTIGYQPDVWKGWNSFAERRKTMHEISGNRSGLS